MSQVSSTKKLLSASASMAAGTMISRVLGVVRVMLVAFILGNGTRQADMLNIATMVPNALYILLAGGALNTVLVPQIVRAIKNDEDGGEAYTNRIMTAFMLAVAVVAVVITAAAPIVTSLYTSSAWRTDELAAQYASMVALTYLTLPQIFLYGAFFLFGQILNARDKFGPMMWAPIANNVISILVMGLYLVIWGNEGEHTGAFTPGQIAVLGLGSTIGILAQLLVLLPFIRRVGFNLRPRFDLRGTGLGKTFSLTKWTFGFVAVNQIALMVVNQLATSATASGHGAGATVYSNAHLLWILPHSLITVSLATAMLPNASRLAASGDLPGVAQEFTKTVRLSLVAIVPATVAFISLAGPMSALLFGHGRGTQDAGWIAWTLMATALGLIPFTVQFVCLRTFYALEDTKTPFLLQLIIGGANIVGAIVFVWAVNSPDWVAAALGCAFSLSYFVGVFFSWRSLKRRVPDLAGQPLIMHIARLLIGGVIGGVIAYALSMAITSAIKSSLLADIVSLVVGGGALLGVYLVTAKLFKVRELASLAGLLRNRFGRRSSPEAARDELTVTSLNAQALFQEEMPTVIRPAILVDPADADPPTLIRNRPIASGNDFSDAPVAPARPFSDASASFDMDSLFRPPAADSEATTRIASVGTLLETRFELAELLSSRHGTETWRALDQVLSRDVVVHVVAPGDERITSLLAAARKGAAATDSRFLRVLDAAEVLDPTSPVGAYVVAEFSPGRSLTELLSRGPLSAVEAAYVAHELSDALAGVHAQGLFHEQVGPDSVIITNGGAIRLVGFGIEATIAGTAATSWSARESADVRALGKLLYAMLVSRWPDGAAYGLPAAPMPAGELAPAHAVIPGVSPALARVCTAALTDVGAAGQRQITTAAQFAAATGKVLGTADASADLEARVRSWSPASATWTPTAEPEAAQRETRLDHPVRPQADPTPAPVSSQSPVEHREAHPRRGLWILLTLAAVALVVSLLMVALNGAKSTPDNAAGAGTTPAAQASTPADPADPGGPITIASVTDFDPESDGGNAEENPDLVANATDGDPGTSWKTLRYLKRADFGGLKPGVGLLLDLGEQRTVNAVQVNLNGDAETALQIMVPNGEKPSMKTVANWEAVAADDQATGATELRLADPTTTRYLLVYVTNLPEVDGGFQAEINEISVS